MFAIKRLEKSDRPALRRFWKEHWGDDSMVAHGRVYTLDGLEGFAALTQADKSWVGLVTFLVESSLCEITSLDSLRAGLGIGTALLGEARQEARKFGCDRLRLVTTNDNTHALRFYQKFGFELTALHPRAMDEARKLKPSIPLTGHDGIPIRDELVLELRLDGGADLHGS
jgi:ribosomal protein S18 acetylase RimI-like enzyme